MSDHIEHIVVLMLENRSFDHFFGNVPHVNGIDPNNPHTNIDRLGSQSPPYSQKPDALRKLSPDPAHETKNVERQISGDGLGQMGGFVHDFALAYPKSPSAWGQVMSYFPLGSLPAIHQLAQSFCVCDPWFSSVPGPTWTNRFFVHSGTSQGWVEMPHPPFHWNLHKYDQTTVYDRLNEKNISWKIYFGDIPQSLLLYNQRKRHNARNYKSMRTFFSDAATSVPSSFPAYVFIEPSYLPFGQNDQHPPHDVLKGDDLIASVYNALRGNPALWASTLLVITWDEHGGFYDHVYPPAAMPPDDKVQDGCNFDQYGVRVPTVLASPFVQPRGVFEPVHGVLDHTSILRYLTEKFGLGPLGNRVANAASIGEAIVDVANDGGPQAVGMAPRPLSMAFVPPSMDETLNPNQAALIDFTRQLEIEMSPPPAEAGVRMFRAASSLQGEVEVAKERVAIFLQQQS